VGQQSKEPWLLIAFDFLKTDWQGNNRAFVATEVIGKKEAAVTARIISDSKWILELPSQRAYFLRCALRLRVHFFDLC
jgi:hypothetical protein